MLYSWTYVGLPRCKNLWHFFFVLLARSGVWLLFNGLWTLLFSLFYVIPPTPATWCYWGTTQPISLMLEVRNTHCFECKFLFEKKGFNRFRAGLNKLAIICKEEIPVITFFGNKHQLYYFLRMTLPNTEHQEMERAKNCDSIHSNIMSSQLALKSMM